MKQMKCSICKGKIEIHRNPDTNQIIWNQGNNADPINDGRCCDNCNATKVIPARFEMHRTQIKTIEA
jgi:putative lipase involved disintegration of autophagic bodies